MTKEEIENNYIRLKKIKQRIKNKPQNIKEVIERLIEILEEEQDFLEGSLMDYDVIHIYELLTGEII